MLSFWVVGVLLVFLDVPFFGGFRMGLNFHGLLNAFVSAVWGFWLPGEFS